MIGKDFYGYTVYEDGTIENAKGNTMYSRLKGDKYYTVTLRINGKPKYFALHRIVYYLFVEHFNLDNPDLCITAKDGNLKNVNPNNLMLLERKKLLQGDGNKKVAKVDKKTAEKIKNEYSGKPCVNQYDKTLQTSVSYRDLAKKYGLTKGAIAQIVKGKSWNEENYKLK